MIANKSWQLINKLIKTITDVGPIFTTCICMYIISF